MNYPDDNEIKVGNTFSLEGEMTGLLLCYLIKKIIFLNFIMNNGYIYVKLE
ncbi:MULTISPECIES: hypothetical protein [Snodgrassella]|uniref:hypothetical protein n=1 Tax=Snodgrassella TaxID=1193515 RepID=UPI0008161B53|nr:MULTISPECIES: hypothetical protein [Snodgrassella]SCC20912.1 hypothetical protein GA0061082_1192 [Snodgrassella sp. R-53583]